MRIPALAAIVLLLACTASGCVTLHLAAGPTVDFEGRVGVEGALTLGLGKRIDDEHAWFFSSRAGGGMAPTKHGLFVDQLAVDYVSQPDHSHGRAFRLGPRFGARIVFEDEMAEPQHSGYSIGAAAAYFPFTWRSADSGYHSEKGWDPFDWHSVGYQNLGLELQLDLLPGVTGGAAGQAWAAITWEMYAIAH